jgi:ribosomal protein S18 acetylase RimI-like enzyme
VPGVRIVQAATETDWGTARRLIEAYAASLGVDLCFQNIDDELAHMRSMYAPPRGAMLLASDGDEVLGCVALRAFDDTTGEMKRLYVLPAARGRALGRVLAAAVVAKAREAGYARLVLDTLPDMHAAQALYVSMGFNPIDSYRYNPVPGAVYMELRLR